MPSDIGYNRILLPQVPIFEETSPGEHRAIGRLLPFLLEEFIGHGVIEIIVEDSWRYKAELLSLPSAFQSRVKTSKSEKKSTQIALKLFEPFFDEYGLEAIDGGVRHIRTLQDDDQKNIAAAGIASFFHIPVFLSALELRAQCNFDLAQFIANLTLVKNHSRSPETRANCASLLGIFSSYKTATHHALISNSNAPEELARRFSDFTQDLYFQKLSEEIHSLGFVKRGLSAIPKINRLVRQTFDRNSTKKIMDYGSKAVTVATGVPLPDSSLADSLLAQQYLPPIVDLNPAILRAKKNFSTFGDTERVVGIASKLA